MKLYLGRFRLKAITNLDNLEMVVLEKENEFNLYAHTNIDDHYLIDFISCEQTMGEPLFKYDLARCNADEATSTLSSISFPYNSELLRFEKLS